MPRKVVTPERLSKDFVIDTDLPLPLSLNLNPDQFVRDPVTGVISIGALGDTFHYDSTGAVEGSVLRYDADNDIWRCTNDLSPAAIVAALDTYLNQTAWRVPATVVVKTTDYVLQATDFAREKLILMNVATANAVTIPAGLNVIERQTGVQYGTGLTTIVPGPDVTLLGADLAYKNRVQFSSWQLIPVGIPDTYVIIGDLKT